MVSRRCLHVRQDLDERTLLPLCLQDEVLRGALWCMFWVYNPSFQLVRDFGTSRGYFFKEHRLDMLKLEAFKGLGAKGNRKLLVFSVMGAVTP